MPVPPEATNQSASQTPGQNPGTEQSGQPPIGSSPATQPVANRGLQAAGLAKLQVIVRQLETLLPVFGAGSDAGKAVLESLNKLSKHVQPGDVSQGVEQTQMAQMLMQARQQAPQVAAMRAAAGGAGGQPPQGGATPQVPPALAQLMMQRPQGSA